MSLHNSSSIQNIDAIGPKCGKKKQYKLLKTTSFKSFYQQGVYIAMSSPLLFKIETKKSSNCREDIQIYYQIENRGHQPNRLLSQKKPSWVGGWVFSVQNSNVNWLFKACELWFTYKQPACPLPLPTPTNRAGRNYFTLPPRTSPPETETRGGRKNMGEPLKTGGIHAYF